MTEVEDLLTRYNVDSQNSRLRDYYESDNLWRTLRIERDENRHSAFLAWILEKDATNANSPFQKFLNLIIRKEDSEEAEYKELKKAILQNQLKPKSVKFSVEKVISALSIIRFNDRIDIYANCEISGVGNYSRLEIIIENKIDAKEGNSKVKGKLENITPEEETYKNKKQTERYYYACSKEHHLRKASFDAGQTLQLFVFLTAKNEDPADNYHFVKITYQDLVDFILEPYLNRDDIDSHTSMAVKEYLRILGNPINNSTTMATTSEEKELLIDFYNRNEDLFKRALEVMRDNAESDEEEKNYNAMLDSMKKSRARRFFKINGDDKDYKMYEVVAEFVKYLRRKGMTFEEAEEVIKKYSKEGNCHVSVNRNEVKRSEKSFETDFEGEPFYVTKEWGLGSTGRNFDGLQKGIKQDYPDFVIEEI